ncbi:MAG: NAD-dependent epimerase/dehydratase family protein [Deltaproteobacteria bacterium]|nr:NAD-dependent epimerase/dehydratase family protein [Deltaproteobacteria bacterium]
MKIFLTGGTGFLGSHVAEKLIAEQHEVRALVRASSKTDHLEALGVELVHASLETGEGLAEALEGCEGVVHCAGIVKARSREEFFRVNEGGTRTLVEEVLAAAPALKRFVHISSLEAQGPSPTAEEDTSRAEPHPVTHYGESKLAAEKVVLEYADRLPVTILRPTAIYGPRDIEMFAFFQSVSRGLMPLMGGGHLRATVVYGPDAAEAIVKTLLTDHPSGTTHYLTDGADYTWGEMGEVILESLGKSWALRLALPVWLFRFVALFSEAWGKLTGKAVMLTRNKVNALEGHWLCSPASMEELVGWKPRYPWKEGVPLTVEWYRKERWL